ncbi:MAG: PorT family protein [Cyclobacteriaceae bacterium]
MRKIVLSIIAISICGLSYGQFMVGPKVGISSSKMDLKNGTVDGAKLLGGDAVVGFHAGAFARVTLGSLYVQPEALFTQSGGETSLDGEITLNNQVLRNISELSFNKLDVPVMVGTKFARVLRVQAGPTVSILLNADAKTDLGDIDIKSGYQDATIGYQAGVGLDIWNLILDLKYEGNLSTFGDSVLGIQTDQRNNQWIFSVGFKLF